jgi:translation initiation factor eIF-2B subunit delta
MMAAIENAVATAYSRYLETGDAPGAVSDTIEAISSAPEGMALSARKVVPHGTVMTYSYSSTVIELLTRLKPKRVIISEARPTGEGLRVARELVRAGISMTLITEAQMGLFVNETDAVMVGADTVLPEGDFINKIGTKLLALAAKDADVPFYSATETLKVAAPSEPIPFAPEEGKASEVCADNWLEVRNVYYEVTPAYLVTSYITEHGVLDPAEVQTYSGENERRWQALMNSHEM